MVWDVSVVGNIQPSDSVFNGTPRTSIQWLVSEASNVEKRFLNSLEPLG